MDALPALTSDRLLLLLIAGGVFSLAGLWMMFRPANEGDAAKLELFGLKFQSSSAGLLVFLIGALFFVGGILLPERGTGATGDNTQISEPAGTGVDGTATSGGSTLVQAAEPPAPALTTAQPRAVTIDGKEAGDNDTMPLANELPLGTSVLGSVKRGDFDFFTVALPDGMYGKISFNLNAKNDVWMQVFDDLGGKINACWAKTCRLDIQHARYFVQVGLSDRESLGNKSFGYSLTIAAREE